MDKRVRDSVAAMLDLIEDSAGHGADMVFYMNTMRDALKVEGKTLKDVANYIRQDVMVIEGMESVPHNLEVEQRIDLYKEWLGQIKASPVSSHFPFKETKFIDSVGQWLDAGRELTPKQRRWFLDICRRANVQTE